MNFKRLKMKVRKGIDWGSPRQYQDQGSNPNHAPAKRPSWYCKKLKARHNYVWESNSSWSFHNEICQNFRCTGCGKNKSKWVKRN